MNKSKVNGSLWFQLWPLILYSASSSYNLETPCFTKQLSTNGKIKIFIRYKLNFKCILPDNFSEKMKLIIYSIIYLNNGFEPGSTDSVELDSDIVSLLA